MSSKTLPTLIRISSFELNEKQKALADLQRAEDAILLQQQQLEEQKQKEQNAVKENPELGNFYEGFLKGYLVKRQNLAKSLEDIRLIIDQAREVLREAFQQHKTYEITHENILKKEQEELDQKIQKDADEMALNFHNRKK